MEFRILGQVEIRGSRAQVRLAGTSQSALLVALLLGANHVVPLDALVDATWGEEAPDPAAAALHTRIFRLRRALGEVDTDGSARIVTHGSGYLFEVRPGELDLDAFQRHVTKARQAIVAGQTAQALREFDAGLELWHGPALSGVPGRFAEAQADSLNSARLGAVEDRIEAGLAVGRHAELVPELKTLVVANPLRERLRGQLMLALHRCGQHGEALGVYRDVYRLLDEELGVRPDSQLQQLHQQMLVADPVINAPEPSMAPAPLAGVVPRQLPTDVANFTGRAGDLDRLDAVLDGNRAGAISTIAGTAGVGKTALALHWAHRIADRLPDGQLYVNLRGYSLDPPMAPSVALARFLRALGVPQERIPVDEDERAAMYRSLLSGRKMLVLLDNAATAAQVRPLLPAGPSCLVLITSRDDLRDLTAPHDVHRIALDVLSPDEACQLLAQVLGEQRVRAEEQPAAELVKLCGYLPLALRIAAAHLDSHRYESIDSYLATLASGNRPAQLAVDEDEHAGVRASFDLSYQTLPPDCARLLRRLGLVPGPDFSAAALDGSTA